MRRFEHADGRTWAIERRGRSLTINITLPDDAEPIVRTRDMAGEHEAALEEIRLVEEQVADGFVEITPPPWRRTLDRWLALWRDAGVDVEEPNVSDLAARMERLIDMCERWPADHRGAHLDLDDAIHALPLRREAVRADHESLPLVLLALRDDGEGAYSRAMHAATIVRTDAPVSAKPMLWNLIEKPPAHSIDPAMFERFFDPDDDSDVDRLAALMIATDWRVAFSAAWIAARFGAKRDELFDVLWERRLVSSPDFWPYAALHACERRDDRALIPALQTWRMAARGRIAQTIGDVLNALSS